MATTGDNQVKLWHVIVGMLAVIVFIFFGIPFIRYTQEKFLQAIDWDKMPSRFDPEYHNKEKWIAVPIKEGK